MTLKGLFVPDIHIMKEHQLGLGRARDIALQWAADARQSYGMQCSHEIGETHDWVLFKQSGVQGALKVAADHFELTADLGFLFKGFRHKITNTIESRLESLLASPAS